MTRPYAAGTTVDPAKSRSEIDVLLTKHGASHVAIMNAPGEATIQFDMNGNRYRLKLPMPTRESCTPHGGIYEPEGPYWNVEAQKRGIKQTWVPSNGPQGWTGWPQARKDAWVQKVLEQKQRERWRVLVIAIKAKLEIAKMGVSSMEREFFADLVLPGGMTAYQAVGDELIGAVDGAAREMGQRLLGAGGGA
jgi:hypothetical protein